MARRGWPAAAWRVRLGSGRDRHPVTDAMRLAGGVEIADEVAADVDDLQMLGLSIHENRSDEFVGEGFGAGAKLPAVHDDLRAPQIGGQLRRFYERGHACAAAAELGKFECLCHGWRPLILSRA